MCRHRRSSMTSSVQKRNLDLSVGYASLALFGASIIVLIWFLVERVDSPEPLLAFVHREIERATDGRGDARPTFNVLLLLAWRFLHSLLTRPRLKVHLQKVLRPHLEPAVYSIIASAGLIAVCLLYRPIPREVYVLEGGAALLVRLLFYAAWALFLYCFFHLDVLEVAGLRPILRYVDGVGKSLEPFRPAGPFLWVRHPVARFREALAYRYSPDQARPLFFASLLLDADLWGMRPRGFRVTCFLLHLACGVLLYLLLKRPPGTAEAALAGTALFLLHPLQSESVLYIWGRSEVLSTLFGLAAMLLALRAGERAGPGSTARFRALWAGALGCTALGLASKEETVALPVIFFLWWTLAEGRPASPALGRAAVLAAPVALFLVIPSVALGEIGRQVYVRSVFDNILGQGVVTLQMLRLFFVPIGQSIDHPLSVPDVILGSAAIAVWAALVAGAMTLAAHASGSPAVSPAASRFAGGLLIAAASSILYLLVPLPYLLFCLRPHLLLVGASLSRVV